MQSKGTVISVRKVRELQPGTWGYQITGVDEKKVSVKVCTSASAIVGKYQLFVDTIHKLKDGASQKCRYCHPDDIFVIFNPWCQGKNKNIPRNISLFFHQVVQKSVEKTPLIFSRFSYHILVKVSLACRSSTVTVRKERLECLDHIVT